MRRWTRSKFWLWAGLAFATTSAIAQTVSLELKNGDRITGQVLSETNNRVTLSNVFAREIVVPLAEITKRTVLGTTNAATAKVTLTNTPAHSNGVAMAKAVAATNVLFTSPLLKNWHGDVQVGADLTFSERNRQVYNAKAKFTYAKDRLKSIFEYDMTYGRIEVEEVTVVDGKARTNEVTQTDANRMNGSIKVEYDLTKKWYAYNLAAMGYDEIRKIDLLYEIGPGLGYHLIRWTNFFVNVEAGASYRIEERADDTRLRTFSGRLAQNATWKITPRLTWDEKFEYLPRLEDLRQYRMRFETNLRYALLQNIFFNLSLIDTYDSDPATGITQNDLQVRSSVGVKF
jgi:hypothetical protein